MRIQRNMSSQERDFINKHFPIIMEKIFYCENLNQLEKKSGYYFSSVPISPEEYANSGGWSNLIKSNNLPQDYSAYGIINAGSSEYLFIILKNNSKLFWFYYQYVCFMNIDNSEDYIGCNKALALAVEKWINGKENVFYRLTDFITENNNKVN